MPCIITMATRSSVYIVYNYSKYKFCGVYFPVKGEKCTFSVQRFKNGIGGFVWVGVCVCLFNMVGP